MGSTGCSARRVPERLGFLRIVAGRAAETLLLNPADDVGGTILDRDLSRLGRAEKDHRFAVHKGHVCKIKRDVLGPGVFLGKRTFQFANVFLSELAAEA